MPTANTPDRIAIANRLDEKINEKDADVALRMCIQTVYYLNFTTIYFFPFSVLTKYTTILFYSSFIYSNSMPYI